eukprot:CAMPEP_0175138236 /NCGR_PEP_ID=MMETSP0087-20121206/10236_1 /TAXON_ID=136419 /ORGANISM="Unknown Unknown, Strain D1" /LENGTH=536 /DNA_ID=CAMNT_0016421115 /DNA_START=40 /DNA_END=1650 /DNA_ORIENTATION=-
MATPDQICRYGDSKATQFAKVADVAPADVPKMVAGMREVFDSDRTLKKEWRIQQLKNLKRMIMECKEELCEALQKDLHKSPFEGFATELGLCISEINVALDELGEWMKPEKKANSPLNIPCWSTTQRDPLGMVLVMGAWNYPMQLSLVPMVGAICGGNCVVLKPGSYAVASSNCLARVIPRYMDPDCIKVVEGNRDLTSALLKERWDKIFFTGSGYVGRVVARAAAEHMTPCVLELGGKSPCIIDRSADLEHAVERLVWGTFVNGGQTCVRPDFVMVHEAVADAFFQQVQKTIVQFYGSDPQQSQWFGRCINAGAFKRLSKLTEENKDYVVVGGQVDAADKFISPTVFDFGSNLQAFEASSLMQDELFGPLLPCFRYSSIDSVVSFVRRLPTGKPLALYAFTQNPSVAHTIKTRTTSGGLNINDVIMHLANHTLPFGGVGSSGMGNYHGRYSFDCFTHEKAVLEKSQFLDQSIAFKPLLAARFPPYTPLKQNLVKVFTAHIMDKVFNFPLPFLRKCLKLLALYFVFYSLGFRITKV